jgi:RNA polymerase sigma-70 factor (ECF subfamily)
MYQNPRRLRRPEERVGNVTNADLPPPARSRTEDGVLVQLIRDRDERAFQQVLDRYYSSMLRVASAFVRTRDEAEEVVQETWMAVLSGIDRFEGRSAFKTWLFRILINRARSRARREARSIPFSALPLAFEDSLPGAVSPEHDVLAAEVRALLESAIASLPRAQRQVISLRDVEGWSAQEVCGALALTESNQRVLLHRARMKVRDQLAPYFATQPVAG